MRASVCMLFTLFSSSGNFLGNRANMSASIDAECKITTIFQTNKENRKIFQKISFSRFTPPHLPLYGCKSHVIVPVARFSCAPQVLRCKAKSKVQRLKEHWAQTEGEVLLTTPSLYTQSLIETLICQRSKTYKGFFLLFPDRFFPTPRGSLCSRALNLCSRALDSSLQTLDRCFRGLNIKLSSEKIKLI